MHGYQWGHHVSDDSQLGAQQHYNVHMLSCGVDITATIVHLPWNGIHIYMLSNGVNTTATIVYLPSKGVDTSATTTHACMAISCNYHVGHNSQVRHEGQGAVRLRHHALQRQLIQLAGGHCRGVVVCILHTYATEVR